MSFLAVAVLFSNFSFAAVAYQPNDVNIFINTAQCPSCDLSMIDLTGPISSMIVKTNNPNFYMGANLQNANVTGSVFASTMGAGLNMQNSNFSNLKGSEVSFMYDQLDGSSFANAILEGARFGNANLTGVDFTGADLKGAIFSSANLSDAKITPEQLSETTHCQTILPNDTISTSCNG